MKQLTSYIIEKFKINKNTKSYEKMIDMYHEGDLCLHVMTVKRATKGDFSFFIEGIKIIEILSDDRIKYQYITNLSNYNSYGTNQIIVNTNIKDSIYFNNYKDSQLCNDYIIPHDSIKSFLNTIIDSESQIPLNIITGQNSDKEIYANLLGEDSKGNTTYINRRQINNLIKKLNI